MEVEGKVIFDLGERNGTSKAGNAWKAHEYVLETIVNDGGFPRKIHFDFFGDKADQFVLKPGQDIKLYFDIESREYNGRWFTSIRGWKVDYLTGQAPVHPTPVNDQFAPPTVSGPTAPVPAADDDLPF